MRGKVEEELDRLVAEGTLVPIDYSDWAATIVAVVKSDKKSVRICGDFRMTVNPVSPVYIDDMLIATKSEAEHLEILEKVFERLAKADLRIKKPKCKFMARSGHYLGHVIDSEGLHPLPEKVEAIVKAPTPQNVTELKSYLGLLTYYGKFLPNLSSRLAPLYKLLRKNETWRWTDAQR